MESRSLHYSPTRVFPRLQLTVRVARLSPGWINAQENKTFMLGEWTPTARCSGAWMVCRFAQRQIFKCFQGSFRTTRVGQSLHGMILGTLQAVTATYIVSASMLRALHSGQ